MGEGQDLSARAAPMIDQHQSVAIMYADIATAGSFKATSLNEPGRLYLT